MVFNSEDTTVSYSGADMERAFQMGVEQTINSLLAKRFPLERRISNLIWEESQEYKDIIDVFASLKR